jgi:hypothetical protein
MEPDVPSKIGFFNLMILAALFGALSSLLAVGYITLYSQGTKIFEQLSLMVLNINIWPLVLLTIAGVLVGLVIKFFGQNGGLELRRANMPRLAELILAKYRAFCFKHSYHYGVGLQLVLKVP